MILAVFPCSISRMANTSSAKKAERVALRRGVINARTKKGMKETLKKVTRLVSEKNAKAAIDMYPALQKALDKAAKKGVIKANAAARIKSRLAKRIRSLA